MLYMYSLKQFIVVYDCLKIYLNKLIELKLIN